MQWIDQWKQKYFTRTEKLFCHIISSFSSRFGISKSQHLTVLLIGFGSQTCFLASSDALIRRGLVTFNLLINLPQLVTHLHWLKFSQGQFSSSFDSEKLQILLFDSICSNVHYTSNKPKRRMILLTSWVSWIILSGIAQLPSQYPQCPSWCVPFSSTCDKENKHLN